MPLRKKPQPKKSASEGTSGTLEGLQGLSSIMPGNVYWKDRNGCYLGCNDALLKDLSLESSAALIGKTTVALFPTMGGIIQSTDNLVMTSGVETTIEETWESGKIYLAKKIPLKDQAGRINGLLCTAFDITERKRQVQELTQERNLTQLTLDNILTNLPGHVFWLDQNGVMLGCNNQQAKSIGYSSGKEVIGKKLSELLPENEALMLEKVNKEVITEGISVEVEEETTNADGSKGVFLTQKVPMRDDRGNIVGLLGIAFDITDKKQAAKFQIEKAVSEEKAQAMKMLAATIAHELRTPLASISALSSAIKLFLPILIEGYELADQNNLAVSPLSLAQLEALKTLPDDFDQIINSANTFINMLLAKVNLEKSKPNNLTLLSIAECIEKALKQYPFNIGGKGLVKWDNANDFAFKGDELLSTYLLFNLLKNAIYYVTAAGKGEIRIWLERGDEYNIMHFKDSGKGIPADILPHIFEQFYSKTHHGTGVGLAFCKMVMDTYNGQIKCESVEGEFAHFMLLFPVIKEN